MASLQAVAAFIEVLRELPPAVIAPARIGLGRPGSAAELPVITVSMADAHESTIGLGNLVQLAEVEPANWVSTTGRRVKGRLRVELWAADNAAIAELTGAVLDHANARAAALREAGFAALSLQALGPAQPLRSGSVDAHMMPLAYAAVFEHLVTPPPGGEGVIRTVQVDLTGEIGERMDIH